MSMTMEPKICIPADRLRAYLEGWAGSDDVASTESHVAECQECEQTLLELESDGDTLIESPRTYVRSLMGSPKGWSTATPAA